MTSAVAALTVNVPPGITTQPQSQAVVQGQNAVVLGGGERHGAVQLSVEIQRRGLDRRDQCGR